MGAEHAVIQPCTKNVFPRKDQRELDGLYLVHFQSSKFPLHGVRRLLVKTDISNQIDPRNNAHHLVGPKGERPPEVPCI